MFSRPRDCIGHESNCTLSGPQSSGVMRHKIDATRRSCDASGTEARNVATTFRRSEETYIDDTQRCHEVRAENAPKVAEEEDFAGSKKVRDMRSCVDESFPHKPKQKPWGARECSFRPPSPRWNQVLQPEHGLWIRQIHNPCLATVCILELVCPLQGSLNYQFWWNQTIQICCL